MPLLLVAAPRALVCAAAAARERLNSFSDHRDRWRTYDMLEAITEELRLR